MTSKETLRFLESKWRVWYKNLDVNHDGVVSRDDYKSALTAFESYYAGKVSDATMKKMRKGFAVYWDDVILGAIGHKDCLDEDEFIASMVKQYTTDKAKFQQMTRHMFESIIAAADADENGLVSFEEFVVIFAAFGHANLTILRAMFNDYGPNKNDEISLTDMTNSWIDILIGEDPNHVNIVTNAFTRGAKPGQITM